MIGFLESRIGLFVSESHDGIDPHSFPRRYIRREQRDRQKQQRDAGECDAVDRVESIEYSAQQISRSLCETPFLRSILRPQDECFRAA